MMQIFDPPVANIKLPVMRHARQQFQIPPAIDVRQRIDTEWEEIKDGIGELSGAEIAVGVGSRGIAGIQAVVRRVVARLKAVGARPFIVPAMGSHGGANAKGQLDILARLGITESSVGAPVRADMEVVPLGETDGISFFISKLAHQAHGIVLINRVKPHTDFTGSIESGIFKMLVIGLGNQKGAEYYHKMAFGRGLYQTIRTVGRALLEKTNFMFGAAIVENQDHEICDLRLVPPDRLEETEEKLLVLAKESQPKLPLDDIDLLIVDQMGKNFSGAGLDPNVVGASSCKRGVRHSTPRISRIFVRSLSDESDGNGSGIGMVDVATARLVEAVDWEKTSINAVTAGCPEDCKVPMMVRSEKTAISVSLNTIRLCTPEKLRLVHIKNTLELDELYLSDACLSDLKPEHRVKVEPQFMQMHFNDAGDLEYRTQSIVVNQGLKR